MAAGTLAVPEQVGAETAPHTAARLARLFLGARIVVALCLLALQGALHALQSGGVAPGSLVLDLVLGAYLLETVLSRWLLHLWLPAAALRPVGFWGLTAGVDLGVFALLQWSTPDGSGYLLLFMFPVLMAGSLGTRLLAHAVAAAATLVVLTRAWLRFAGFEASGADSVLAQPALACIGFFAVAELTYQLAQRLRREEERAQIGFFSARQQALLNQTIVDELDRGVMVVAEDGRVRLANPAALRLLAWPPGSQTLAADPRYRALADAVTGLFSGDVRVPRTRAVALAADGGVPLRLQLRGRVLQAGHPGGRIALLFLDDERELERRLQQEKLAAMGRMSASIAHEIRNPLAAIVSANALLAEDAHDADGRKLLDLVATNAQRLSRIVRDVLDVAHMQLPEHATHIDLAQSAARIVADWARVSGDAGRLQQRFPAAGAALPVCFDPEHLRRVLCNLLDNAARYASAAPDAICVVCARVPVASGGANACLSVLSDGAPLADATRTSLFEPFFSTEARGTGLGLYICRELCARYGAQLDYRRIAHESDAQRGYNEFRITAPVAAGEAAAPRTAGSEGITT